MIQLLTQQGADLAGEDMDGNNALIYTCMGRGDLLTVTWLLDQGLDVNHKNRHGCTAYHIAAGNGHASLLSKLKEKGANIQAEDVSGDNALIRVCAFSGDIGTIQCLIDQGVKVTHTNKIGFTAFHYAAQNGQSEIAECLYRSDGRLLHWLSAESSTPLMLACKNGHTETVSTLLRLAADTGSVSAENESRDHQEIMVAVEARDDTQIDSLPALSSLLHADVCDRAAEVSTSAEQGDVESQTKKRRLMPPEISTKYLTKIKMDQLTVDRNNLLGKGNYGDVYRGIYLGTPVAVKEVGLKSLKHDSISEEIDVSATVRHPNIVAFMGYMHVSLRRTECLRLVYDLIEGDNLEDIIYQGLTNEYNLTLEKKYKVLHQISLALAHLHGQEYKIIHGDIKPSNIMLTKEGVAKLCDLGLSKIKENKTMSIISTVLTRGTPIYMAPEQLLQNKSSSTKSDVYSFGASVYEVIFEKQMWDLGNIGPGCECFKLKEKVREEKVPHILDTKKDEPSYNLIAKCVVFEPENRPEVITLVPELEKLVEKK